LLVLVAAGLDTVVVWLPLFPRAPGQRLTEIFLRSLLIGYAGVLVTFPSLLALSILLVVRARRSGLSRPLLARVGLLCAAALIAALGLELTAAAWLSWVHRYPSLPTRFPAIASDKNDLSLVVIGGSTALGYPYDPALSMGQIVAWQLEEATPGRRVLVDIRAKLGQNLEDMHTGLAELRRRPDILIIYSGHNEFLSRFEESRDAGDAESPQGEVLHALYQLSLHSPFCQWVYETVRKHRVGGPPPRLARHHLIDVPAVTLSERQALLRDFRGRLEAIVDYCERIGAIPVLVIPAANESGFEPNRTVLPAQVRAARRAELTDRFYQARAIERDRPAESIDRYRSIIAQQPEFAEAHFRLGRLLHRAGRFAEAREHYTRARDLDGWPVRCLSEYAQVYKDLAARHGCILVDGPEVLRKLSRNGILDDDLFHDAHHPTYRGHLGLSQAILDELFKRQVLGLSSQAAPAIDQARCAAQFQVDARVWAFACSKAATYFKHFAGARYDPTERSAKEARFLKAKQDILTGTVIPDRSGIPGIGLAPDVTAEGEWWLADSGPPRTSGTAGASGKTTGMAGRVAAGASVANRDQERDLVGRSP
jgi:tetratricopeptide (TPR) repeat protein